MSDTITAYINIPNQGFVPINTPIPTEIMDYASNTNNYEQFAYQQQLQNQFLFQQIQQQGQYLQYQMEILTKIQDEQNIINNKINEISNIPNKQIQKNNKKIIDEKMNNYIIEQDKKIEKIFNDFKIKHDEEITNSFLTLKKEINDTIKQSCTIIQEKIQKIDPKIQITNKETSSAKLKDLEDKIIIIESNITNLKNEEKRIKKDKSSDEIIKEIKQYINNNVEINLIKEDNKELKNKFIMLHQFIENLKSKFLNENKSKPDINTFIKDFELLLQQNLGYVETELFKINKLLIQHTKDINIIKESQNIIN